LAIPTGRIRLSPQRDAARYQSHLWIFDGDVAEVSGTPAPGDVVDVFSAKQRFVGRGFYNPHSKIRVRLLTFREEPIDEPFFIARLQAAVALRELVVSDATACRLVYGEGDLLPGLIVDRFGDTAVMQALGYGMDLRKDMLAELLLKHGRVNSVYLRNDAKSRALEGLPLEKGFVRGTSSTTVEIREAGARFLVDIAEGQKTGWFCDQRDNRLAAARVAQGSVLEVFCHSGAFGIQAALHGARSVEGVDVSASAVTLAHRHAELNGVEARCRYRQADAFEELRRLERESVRYDMIILDPPAFARSKHAIPHALAGYKEINLRGIRLLRSGGVLVSCSCSHPISDQEFWSMLQSAARDAGRQVRLLEQRGQAPDHPVLFGMPETRYLKCYILQAF
jgi:23S rRNA (cytosine1962-C5)-methyltransferase